MIPTDSAMQPTTNDRIATSLLRTGLDPTTGRCSRPGTLAIGLRAALLADLALAGAIRDDDRAPSVAGAVPLDPILAALYRAIAARPQVAWRRWYRHVEADRLALTDELIAQHRWSVRPGARARRRFTDHDPAAAAALGQRAAAVGADEAAATGPAEAVLGLLVTVTGAVSGRRQRVRNISGQLAHWPHIDEAARTTVTVAIATAAQVLRGRARWH